MNIYETQKLLAEYLLFHYAAAEEVLPYGEGPREALNFPVRCVSYCVDAARLPPNARALDLGCAVGRASFELARHCTEVVAIDHSRSFIAAADELSSRGFLPYERIDEGVLGTGLIARVPDGIDCSRVHFETGDAMALRDDLGSFDVVLMANLIDRLSDPVRCLARLPALVKSGGLLLITSPYTWLEEFTPRERWLGGFHDGGREVKTLDRLRETLSPHFSLTATHDIPFLIREHARKFQWSVAEASLWIRH